MSTGPTPLFGRVLGGIAVTLGFVAAVVQIILFVLWFKDDTQPPSGWELVAVISFPLAALFVIVLGLLIRLGKITNVAEAERSKLSTVTNQLVRQRIDDQATLGSLIKASQEQTRAIDRADRRHQLASDLSHMAHEINRKLATDFEVDLSKDHLYAMLRTACRDIVLAYERALAVRFRSSIKYLIESSAPMVVTICRDRGKAGDTVEHLVQNNTDFREIWYRGMGYWICGDISTYPGYANTTPDHLSRYRAVATWPLIVREGWGFRDAADRGNAEPIVGFLCLDSLHPNIITEEEHVAITFPVADALAACFERRFALDQPEGKPSKYIGGNSLTRYSRPRYNTGDYGG